MTSNLVESVSGARGVVGETMTPHLALQYGLAFGTFIGDGTVLAGGDSRTSHHSLKCAVMSGLMAAGCDVIDIGVCPTPTVGMAVKHLHAAGAIAVTASHNPVEWNGLKLFGNKGEYISPAQYEIFSRVVSQPMLPLMDWRRIGKLALNDDAIEFHVARVLSVDFIKPTKIKKRKFRVVIDCVNGGGSVAGPMLLNRLGCEVTSINDVPDGRFPHVAEPVPGSLRQLCRAVKAHKAEIGFALDPDADRLAIVSEKGHAIGEEHTLALSLMATLPRHPGNVVVNMSTSRMCQDVAEMHGCRLFRSKVGEANVVDMMKRHKAVAGGEGNGGVILPASHSGRDSLMGMALVLQHLCSAGKTVSEAMGEYPNYVIVKEKGELAEDFDTRLQSLKGKLTDAKLDETDGVRIDFADSWVHIRRSNTETIYRIIAEARTKQAAVSLIDMVRSMLGQ